MPAAPRKKPAKKPAPRKRTTPRRTEPILQPRDRPVLAVELENGKHARLRDPAKLTNGQRRPISIVTEDYNKERLDPTMTRELQKAVAQNNVERQTELLAAVQLDSDESAELRVADVLITVLVEEWSLDLPLPDTAPKFDEDGHLIGSEILDDLLAHDYDRLRWATARLLPALKRGPGETSPSSRPT